MRGSDLIKHEPDVSLLVEAAAQTAQDLQTKGFISGSVIARVDVCLDLEDSESVIITITLEYVM